MVIGTSEGYRQCARMQDELRSRFTSYDTSFDVSLFRDANHFEDVVSIRFYHTSGEARIVEQRWPQSSMWGWVGLEDETIAKIMLLIG